jgi:hypothetical protein
MRSNEIVKATGVSLRQLQWWDERGIIRPAREHGAGGQGLLREYSDADLRKIRIMKELRDKGLGIQTIRKLLPKIIGKDFAYVAIIVRRVQDLIVETRVNGFFRAEEVIQFAAKVNAPVYVLALEG